MEGFGAQRTGKGGGKGARASARRGGTYGTGAARSKSRYPNSRGSPRRSFYPARIRPQPKVQTQSCSLCSRKGKGRRWVRMRASSASSASILIASATSMSVNALALMDDVHGQHQRRNAAREQHRCSQSAFLVSTTAQHSARTATPHAWGGL